MQRLFAFLYARRSFLVFLLLQVICFWLIVQNNAYYSASFYTSSNQISGNVYRARQATLDYFKLKDINQQLAEENAQIREIIYAKSKYHHSSTASYSNAYLGRIDFKVAKVINNSVFRSNNSLTLNIGKDQGVEPGMGVITGNGIVGRVKACSQNFSTVTSVLHPNMFISCVHKKSKYLCEANWTTRDPLYINVLNIPRHVIVNQGDSILTSSYNGVFPEDVLVGVIEEVVLEPDKSFYTIKAKLGQDMGLLSHVYVVGNKLRDEQKKLEQASSE